MLVGKQVLGQTRLHSFLLSQGELIDKSKSSLSVCRQLLDLTNCFCLGIIKVDFAFNNFSFRSHFQRFPLGGKGGIVSEQELVRMARAGEESAFVCLANRHLCRLLREVGELVPLRSVEALAHAVLLTALRRIGELKDSFFPWLEAIMLEQVLSIR